MKRNWRKKTHILAVLQNASIPTVVDPRYQFQVDDVLGWLHQINLKDAIK